MRTTVDLPPAVHRRALALARDRHQSLSAVVAELTARALAQLDDPVRVDIDPDTGLPVIGIGAPITAADVADILDEE